MELSLAVKHLLMLFYPLKYQVFDLLKIEVQSTCQLPMASFMGQVVPMPRSLEGAWERLSVNVLLCFFPNEWRGSESESCLL